MKSFVLLVIINLIEFTLILLFLRSIYRQRHWVRVQASVRRTEVRVLKLGRGQRYQIFTWAYYQAQSHTFEYTDSFDGGYFWDYVQEDVDRLASGQYAEGSLQTILYNPNDHSQAITDIKSRQEFTAAFIVFSLVFYLPALLLL